MLENFKVNGSNHVNPVNYEDRLNYERFSWKLLGTVYLILLLIFVT